MKKHLLCTSAVALAAVAAPAAAQDWNVDWGGYMNSHVAFVDTSGSVVAAAGPLFDYDGLRVFVTGEIIFHPSVTLDNGLTFGVNVQLEAQNNVGGAANNIDESYVQISGDNLGTILIGAENSAGYKSMVGAPGVTSMYINSPSISAFVPVSFAAPFNFRQAGISSYTEVAGNNDVNRVTYFTPDFNGLTLGISYAPNNNCNAAQGFCGITATNSGLATVQDIFDIGAYYSGSMGNTSITIGARYGQGDVNPVVPLGGTVSTWGLGAQLGFGDFTIGGSYTENDNNAAILGGALGQDQSGWSFGATYDAPGPWAFELLTYQGDYDAIVGSGTTDGSDYEAIRIGASRDIGPGVDWDLYAVFVETSFDGTETGAAGNVEGTVIGTALNLSF